MTSIWPFGRCRGSERKRSICAESYRNEDESQPALLATDMRGFLLTKGMGWWFKKTGYIGDHSFIYFE